LAEQNGISPFLRERKQNKNHDPHDDPPVVRCKNHDPHDDPPVRPSCVDTTIIAAAANESQILPEKMAPKGYGVDFSLLISLVEKSGVVNEQNTREKKKR
jgi:hypothetical protein